jgi:carbon monoxide dehydrogenase subunit G
VSLVTASIHIAAPPRQVWEMVMDPRRLHEWVTIHRKLVRADDGPARVGYRMDQLLHLRGVNIEVHWQLVECEPPTLAVWEGRGPARSRAHTEYKLREADGGTCFDYRNNFRAPLGGVGAIVSRALVGGIPEREAQRTLHALCAHYDSSGRATD